MQIIPAVDIRKIKFRGIEFVISATDLILMQTMRQQRIETKVYFIPNGEDVNDHFGVEQIQLKNGGEVCPIEMAVHLGPISGGSRLMDDLFGKNWHDYAGWSPEVTHVAA